MDSRKEPRLFTVPAGAPFLSVLAGHILAGGFPEAGRPPPGPFDLSTYTVLVPTRRAARALADAFLDISDGAALMLPHIRPIGDIDEDELDAGELVGTGDADRLPEAAGSLARRLSVAADLLDLARSPGHDGLRIDNPVQALLLAGELVGLVDLLDTEDIDYAAIAGLIPEEYAAHWAVTREVLQIVLERLPRRLDASGEVGPMQRRNMLLRREADALAQNPPEGPVIVAGSTGSIPATARLLSVVARLDNGAVVLPGLDLGLDEESWANLAPGHPQYGMKQLLASIGAEKMAVLPLLPAGPVPDTGARFRLLGEVMRPIETTDRWANLQDNISDSELDRALDGLTLLTAPGPREEALAITLVLRHALEQEGRTAALVTPDRGLARRVISELQRWGVEADDSAGIPLSHCPVGRLALLVAELAADGFAPVPLLAFLKHPLVRLGAGRAAVRRAARALELVALRGLRRLGGLDGIRRAAADCRAAQAEKAYLHQAVRRLSDRDWAAVSDLVDRLETCFAPLTALFDGSSGAGLEELVRAHLDVLEAVMEPGPDDDTEASAGPWSGDAGEALAGMFTEILQASGHAPVLAPGDYPAFMRPLADAVAVRPRYRRHPRISILGLLEARMMQADVMVLGGLNETVWPPVANVDAWLNRPMRTAIGLPPPERRIGLAAHDFVQAAASPRVYLTRAIKADNAPTVPSRWLLRLEAILAGTGRRNALLPGEDEPWLAWAAGLDRPAADMPVVKPRPAPPVEARPAALSVTRIEVLVRDPYEIFARNILRLEEIDPIDAQPSPADRGNLVHEAMHRFTMAHPGLLGTDALDKLMEIGEEVFARFDDRPAVRAFWWPRFVRAARWFIALEEKLRENVAGQHTEVDGRRTVEHEAGSFTLTARADRIDRLSDGTLRIVDYKTGALPTMAQVERGFSPQLPLEALIAAKGGFAGVDAAGTAQLVYLSLAGGRKPGEARFLSEPDRLVEEAHAGLKALLQRYADPRTVYTPRRAVEQERFARPYDHLSRLAEWALRDTLEGTR